jgi:hypothetical protein
MRLPLRRLIVLGSTAAVVTCAGGQALGAGSPPPGMPPTGHIRLGVGAKKPGAFDTLTHHHHDVWLLFDMLGGSWVKWQGITTEINQATKAHRIAMITLGVTRVSDRHQFSPGELAAGKADAIYISYSKQANATGRPVWFRPMQEMNGHWMSYCAFNANGTRKGAAYSTSKYRAAFRRIAIILRGGTRDAINAELHAAGLRLLQAPLSAAGIPPSGQIALVWNPQGAGSPNVTGNQPRDYYPGNAYVDYVADDLYAQGGNAYWKGMQPLYNYGKPFILGEWAPWGYDDPTFVNKVFSWARMHPRTAAIVYFDYSSTFDLGSKPRSLSAYRSQAGRAVFATTA